MKDELLAPPTLLCTVVLKAETIIIVQQMMHGIVCACGGGQDARCTLQRWAWSRQPSRQGGPEYESKNSFRCPREQRLAGHWIFGLRLTSAILQLYAAKQREAVCSKLFREEPTLL